ncbi:glycine--tRNA ligase [Candidatus Parcubacteria bacterium]|nr:glycine--tRNA ligase [Candidatus Parcubacteria bacterium]
MAETVSMEQLVSLAKRRGFVFQASEIYGGISGIYDWGPYGVEFKNNLKTAWWQEMVYQHTDVVGVDSAIIQNPRVWEASGHVEKFTDPMVDCRKCKNRYRADKLADLDTADLAELSAALKDTKCPNCGGALTEPRPFNMMLKTYLGAVEDTATVTYLRPETCQGIYTNYQNVRDTTRQKLPFGIAQIGKAFRNEITPQDFLFRQREFEQMEMQYFVHPDEADKTFARWKQARMDWHQKYLRKANLRFREHGAGERAHYARAAWDIEYQFSFGFKEVEGVHNRGDWDLSRHTQYSGQDLSYFDETTKAKYIPWVIETSVGVDRLALAVLSDAYTEEEVKGEKRVVLKFHPDIAPVKVAVLPLSKNDKLTPLARAVWQQLAGRYNSEYDETQSIGRRYRRQDEIGTPLCVTVDFESLDDQAVTIRHRDTMAQERVKVAELDRAISDQLKSF